MTYDPTSTGSVTAKDVATFLQGAAGNPTDVAVGGLAGATAASRYVGATTTGIPTSGTFAVGDYCIGQTEGQIYVCTTAGSPGTWKNNARDPLMDGLGLKSWNYNAINTSANSAFTSQTLYGCLIPTAAGQVYTGVKLVVSTAGTSTVPTGFFIGLASTSTGVGGAGTMLAQSDNLNTSAALTTAQTGAFPFNATFTETATGLRYVLFVQNGAFAGTNVTFGRLTGNVSISPQTGGVNQAVTAGTAVTALAANGGAVVANYSSGSSPLTVWVGLY